LDNGGEYKSNNFHIFCQDRGITRQFTIPYSPQQNGVSERKNKTLVGVVLAMFLHSNLLKSYWGETLNTTNDLQNKSPTKTLNNKTPFEIWYGILKPTLTNLKVFGYKVFTLIPTKNKQKLDPHLIECIFLGYSEKSKTYRLMDKSNKRIIISRDVLFDESSIYDAQMHCPSSMKVQKEDFAFGPRFLEANDKPNTSIKFTNTIKGISKFPN
jgi:hypothetical protein